MIPKFPRAFVQLNLQLITYTDHENDKNKKITTNTNFRSREVILGGLMPWGGGNPQAEGVHDGLMAAATEY